MKATAVSTRITYGVFVCTNSICTEGEFASRIPHICVELPACPCCACPAILVEVLRREG